MSITVAVTNFNREQLLYECLEQILDDPRVSEIVISDDASEYGLYARVVDHYKNYPKVKIYRNGHNVDCYLNKHRAVQAATNEWVILFDSDNVLTKDYIDAIERQQIFQDDVIYQPSFAYPHFDFTTFEGLLITGDNVASHMMKHQFQTMLNANNNFFHREKWLNVFDKSIDPVTSDSIYQNYRWLEAGNSIYVVPGLYYEHRVNNHSNEEKSHYVKNNKRTPRDFHNEIIAKLKNMK